VDSIHLLSMEVGHSGNNMKKYQLNKDSKAARRSESISQGGFATLFIVIVLGAVVLALIFNLSTSSVWSIKGSTDTKNSNVAKSLTNACAEVALEALRENHSLTGTASLVLDGNTCEYTVTNTGGDTRQVVASSTYSGIVRKLTINTSTFNPLVISSWVEN